MRDAIAAKLARLVDTLGHMNHAGWTRGHTWTPDVRAVAEAAQERMIHKAERCRYVLRKRYGVLT